jgi:predicted transcriptional regulator
MTQPEDALKVLAALRIPRTVEEIEVLLGMGNPVIRRSIIALMASGHVVRGEHKNTNGNPAQLYVAKFKLDLNPQAERFV